MEFSIKKLLYHNNNILIQYLFYDYIFHQLLSTLEKTYNFLNVIYDIKYFQDTYKVRGNANPKIEIPSKVEQFLLKTYQSREKWVFDTFKPRSLIL